MTTIKRRSLIVGAGALAGAAVLSGLAPRQAAATPEEAKKFLEGLAKGDAKPGKVKITAPEIAENGNAVPVTVSVESPMTAASYVKAVHVVADGNPNPGVASFSFTPACGKCEVQFRLRMAKTQNIIAVAEMSDGSLWTAQQEVKVTIGGCGG